MQRRCSGRDHSGRVLADHKHALEAFGSPPGPLIDSAGDQYVGLAVHRATRICDAGHRGQILLSETTRSLLEDEEQEFEGFELLDLSAYLLKDFDRPVRIYELAVTGLEAEFPPLRTVGDGATTLADRQDDLPSAEDARIVRVLIVDDQALVRAGFRMILEAEPEIEVVGEAADGREAVAESQRLKADVVLMDVRMPEVDETEAARRLLGQDKNPKVTGSIPVRPITNVVQIELFLLS